MIGHRALTVTAALLLLAACDDDDDDAGNPATSFTAVLSGTEEVPPVPTAASGSVTLSISGGEIAYTVEVTELQNAVFAHIHIAPVGESGPVRLNLCGTGDPLPPCTSGTGVLVTGSNGTIEGPITFDSLVSAMRSGGAYVNVHTDDGAAPTNTGPGDMINGEIRGQIVPD